MAVRNYLYGCRRPSDAYVNRIIVELDRMNRYRNALVSIELKRRKTIKEAARLVSPEWANAVDKATALEEQVVEVLAARRAANQSSRKIVKNQDDLGELRKQLNAARAEEKTLRSTAYKLADKEIKAANEQSYDEVRDKRADSNLYWGNYLLVENNAEEFRRGAPPRYTSFTGEGSIGIQIQNGLAAEEVVDATNTRLMIVRRDPPKIVTKNGIELPVSQHPERFREVWLRIGSVPGSRAPEWVCLPVIWSRDLPPDSKIKWAKIQRKFVGGKERWSLVLTIDVPDQFLQQDVAKSGACGIDVGYRVMSDGSQRVAVAYGDDDQLHELRLSVGMVQEWHKCQDIRSIRDINFNTIRTQLQSWLKSHDDLPSWFTEIISNVYSWKSTQRLSKFVFDWNRYWPHIKDEDSILPVLLEWRDREEHLHQYEANLRDQLLARRKHLYRNWVAMLRRRYQLCYIEHMDLRNAIHDTLRPEEEQSVTSTQRAAAAFASISELRNAIKNSGMNVVEINPFNTTATCHACNNVTAINARATLWYECEYCDTRWDQDVNAARNILSGGKSGQIDKTKPRSKKVSRKERYSRSKSK